MAFDLSTARPVYQQRAEYGERVDGTKKGDGFLGPLKASDGSIITELSIGVNIDGREMEIPLITPALSQAEIARLLAGEEPDDEMVEKSARFAMDRIRAGKSPFAGPDEQQRKTGFDMSTARPVEPTAEIDRMRGQQVAQSQGMSVPQAIAEYSPGAIVGESALTLGTGIVGQIAGGLSGLGALAGGASFDEAAQRVRDVSGAMTYQPRTAGGQLAMQQMERIGRAVEFIEQLGGQGTGALAYAAGLQETPYSPASQTIGEVVPAIAGMLVPGGQARRAPVAARPAQSDALRGITQGIQAAESARPGSAARAGALEDLAVRVEPQPEIVRAFEESGVQNVPAPVVSGSQEFRQVATAARSVPASPASIQWKEFLGDVSRRVDELAAQAEAQPLDVLNVNVSTKLNRAIDDARRAEREAYAIVEGADDVPGLIARNEAVDTAPLFDALMGRVDEVGGDLTQLTAADRKMLGRIAVRGEDGGYQPRPMTWAGLTNLRKEMNAARSGKGAFMDAADYEIENYANLVSGTARRNAEAKGFGEEYALAMEATGVKKRAQEAAQQALGKNLDQSFSKILESRGNALAKGQIDEFRKVVNSLGDDQLRREAVSSFVFNKIIDTRNMDNRLAVADFSKWYNDLNAKPQAKAELYKYLDADTQKTIDNIGTMASAIKRANDDFIATGRLATLDDGFKLADSLVGKIGRYALMTKIGPVADMAAGAIQKQSRKLPEAASDLIGSSEFQNFVTRAMADPAGAKARAAERALMASAPWRRFYVRLPEAERTAIRNSGAIAWLQSQEPQEQQQGGGNR